MNCTFFQPSSARVESRSLSGSNSHALCSFFSFYLQSSSARVESRSLSGSNSHALFSFYSFYFNLPLHEWNPDRYRGRTPMLYSPFFLSTLIFLCTSGVPIAIGVELPCFMLLFFFLSSIFLCTSGEIRTPINGFGDRYSTLELHS